MPSKHEPLCQPCFCTSACHKDKARTAQRLRVFGQERFAFWIRNPKRPKQFKSRRNGGRPKYCKKGTKETLGLWVAYL